jgi:uncharacterized protein (UPF0332 family)
VDEAQRAIIAVRMTKAQEDIATAREDFERSRYRAAVARAYYAMFHVSGAALLTIGVERAKHSGVESAFSEFFLKTGRLEPEYGEIYRRGRRFREDQEYADDFERLDADRVEQILADAERFLTRLERYLREVGAIE